MTSRRDFLWQISATAVVASGASPLLTWAQKPEATLIEVPGEDGLIVRSFRFVDLETPVEYFNTWLTPVPRFFVRNHMHEPTELDAATWQLTIGGEVEKPLTLSLSDLA